MDLAAVWFVLIAVLWVGYFILEGFDFGVGILWPVLGKDERRRRVMLNAIGPHWDGNEVWLLTAGGATFAAFPEWYATLFSGFYLPLLLILVALILRGVAFEYRGKRPDDSWHHRWDLAIFWGSLVPAVLWGVAFANLVRGVPIEPIDGNLEFTGTVLDLLNPYALLGGLVTLTLFLAHGALFLVLKTYGDIQNDARALARNTGLLAALLAVGFLGWTYALHPDGPFAILAVLACLAFVAALGANQARRAGWAFTASSASVGLAVTALFVNLYPNVMRSSTAEEFSLTIDNASSTDTTLRIMTVVAVILVPVILLYQGYTYWVFRRRIGVEDIPDPTDAVNAAKKAAAFDAE